MWRRQAPAWATSVDEVVRDLSCRWQLSTKPGTDMIGGAWGVRCWRKMTGPRWVRYPGKARGTVAGPASSAPAGPTFTTCQGGEPSPPTAGAGRGGGWGFIWSSLPNADFGAQPSPSLSSASTGLGPWGECVGAKMEPKNSERNWRESRKPSELRRLLPGLPSLPIPASASSPYLLGWRCPRHCAGLSVVLFLL